MTDREFFRQDALTLAPALLGKMLVRRMPDGSEMRLRITETEAYCGVEDTACHAHKGKTGRSEILWRDGGTIYVYLCYGMHWLMNVITGENGQPQGVLLRAGELHDGPAKLTKYLKVDGSFNGEPVDGNERIWFEDDGFHPRIRTAPRVGIDYAGDYWKSIEWRFIAEKEE